MIIDALCVDKMAIGRETVLIGIDDVHLVLVQVVRVVLAVLVVVEEGLLQDTDQGLLPEEGVPLPAIVTLGKLETLEILGNLETLETPETIEKIEAADKCKETRPQMMDCCEYMNTFCDLSVDYFYKYVYWAINNHSTYIKMRLYSAELVVIMVY